LVTQVTDAGTNRGIHTARFIKLMLDFSESVRYCLFHPSTARRIAVIRAHTWWQLAGQSSERPCVAVFQCHAQAMRILRRKHGIGELAKTWVAPFALFCRRDRASPNRPGCLHQECIEPRAAIDEPVKMPILIVPQPVNTVQDVILLVRDPAHVERSRRTDLELQCKLISATLELMHIEAAVIL
jgi:hypothetical protein